MCWTSCVSGDTGGGAANSRARPRSLKERIFVKRVFEYYKYVRFFCDGIHQDSFPSCLTVIHHNSYFHIYSEVCSTRNLDRDIDTEISDR